MALHNVSLTLNLDTSQFTAKVKDAAGAIKVFKGDLEAVSAALKAGGIEIGKLAAQTGAYSTSTVKLTRSKEELKKAQADYIAGLIRENQTMGLSVSQLKAYEAAELKILGTSKALRGENARKAAAIAKETAETKHYQQVLATVVADEERRIASGKQLIQSLEDENLVIRAGTEALTLERAARLGVASAVGVLLAEKKNLIEAELAGAEATRLAGESSRAAAAATAARLAPEIQLRESLQRQLTSMREQIVLQREGVAGLAAYRAAAIGAGGALSGMVAEIAAADIELSKFTKTVHGSSRSIYEANVLVHEISSGRLRQAIGSFSILLSQIGLAGGAVFALTLSIGLLYGISKPIEEAAKHMEELANKSKELGVSISTLQDLQTASTLVGAKVDGLEKGVVRLDVAFANAKGGSKKLTQAFSEIGISTNEALTQSELLKRAVEGISKLRGPEQVVVATKLFGRAGAELIPVIDKLGGSYDQVIALEEKYGIHNREAIDQGVKLAARFNESKIALDGLGLSFLSAFGGGINSFIQGMSNVVGLLGSFLRDGKSLSGVLDGIKIAAVALGTYLVTQMVGALVGTAAEMFVVNVAFGTGIPLIGAFTAAFETLTAAMLLNPFTAVAIGITAVVTAAYAESLRFREAKIATDDLKSSQDLLSSVMADLKSKTLEETKATESQIVQRKIATLTTLEAAKANLVLLETNLRQAKLDADRTKSGLGGGKAASELGSADQIVRANAQRAYDDGAKAVQTYKEEINGLNNSLDKLAAHETVAPKSTTADIANAIAKVPKVDKTKTAYEDLTAELIKQTTALKDLQADYQRIAAGQDDVTLSTERYRASLQKNLAEAQKYKGATNANDIVDQSVATNKNFATLALAAKSLQDLQKSSREVGVTAAEVWAEYTSGASKAELNIAKLKARLEEIVRLQPNALFKGIAKGIGDKQIADTQRIESATTLIALKDQTEKINRELITDTTAKNKAIVDDEIKTAYERIKWSVLTADEQKKAQTTFAEFVKAENAKLASETPFARLAASWGNATQTMMEASAKWANDFVTQLAHGKLNFSQFTASIVADITEIIVKALVAKYVIGPLLSAFGLPGGSGLTSTQTGGSGGDGGLNFSFPTNHTGGIVGSEATSMVTLDPGIFKNAMKYHTGGIAGSEVPTILQRGEGVFTAGQMKAMGKSGSAAGTGNVQINLNNQSGTPLDADHSGSRFDGEKYILDVVVSNLGRPGTFRNAVRNKQ